MNYLEEIEIKYYLVEEALSNLEGTLRKRKKEISEDYGEGGYTDMLDAVEKCYQILERAVFV